MWRACQCGQHVANRRPHAAFPPFSAAGAPRQAGRSSAAMSTVVGILFGQERTFPEGLARRINEQGGGRVTARPVRVGAALQDELPHYHLILDRISQDVPFYPTLLKSLAARGTQVINNPF